MRRQVMIATDGSSSYGSMKSQLDENTHVALVQMGTVVVVEIVE